MNVALLSQLADYCKVCVDKADADGVELDDGNIVDLCADRCADGNWPYFQPPLDDIRSALIVAGLAPRFPIATSKFRYD